MAIPSSHPPTTAWTGHSRIKGASESTQMLLLTFSMIGLQFAWGTEMTYGTPYLLSLGLSKSKLSLVWVAGPLSGLIMQPVIGMVSDKSTHRWGRRRPFMIGGAVAVSSCLVVLGWAREIAGVLVGGGNEGLRDRVTVWLAVIDIYVLDFVINIAQSTCRALVVDALPVEKQQLGSAWCSRMAGTGHLLIYGIGSLDLKGLLGGFLGDTQFKKICVIAAFAMSVSQGISCWAVDERVLVADELVTPFDLSSSNRSARGSSSQQSSLVTVLRDIYSTTLHLPDRVEAICWVQFWSWIGWFPFLFYGSTWVGEIYLRHEAPSASKDALTDVGRAGSLAMIVFAIISFSASVVMPWLVESPDDNGSKFTPRPPQGLEAILAKLQLKKPTLLTAWTAANIGFASIMVFAPFVRSVAFATLLISLSAVPWAICGWAPGTFLGVEVNRLGGAPSPRRNGGYRRVSNASVELASRENSPKTLHLRHSSQASEVKTTTTGELSGVYFGILNIYTTIPQFIGTGISWVVFSILEPGKSAELTSDEEAKKMQSKSGISGIAVCLFIGAISAMAAARATRRLRG